MAEIPSGYRGIEGSERRLAPGARRVSKADPNERFSFTIRVRRRPGSPPPPDQSSGVANRLGTQRVLAREEVIARSGASKADMDKAIEFARASGFEVVDTSAARRTIRLSGTVEQADRAFGVDLGLYESPEQSYRGREGAVHVPEQVADVIEAVFGLDNRKMARRAGGGPPPGAVPVTPWEVATLYDFPPLSACGQTIGILEFTGVVNFKATDMETFWKGVPTTLPVPVPTLVQVDGPLTSGYVGDLLNPSGDDLEVALDVQVVASVARGANIVMFFAPPASDGWIDAVTTAIYESPIPLTALSISWGAPEDDWDSSTVSQISQAFADAALLGITVFVGSGDQGSNDSQNDGQPHVTYPASDPWVTGCGGTFIADPKSTPFTEGTWNDFAIVPTPTGPVQQGGATGGGVSTIFSIPPWQSETSGGAPLSLRFTQVDPSTTGPLTARGVPDVAGNASPFSPYEIVVYGVPLNVGGTSAVAPLYSSLIAIIAAELGKPPGYLNPTLYSTIPLPFEVFNRIADGVSNELNSGWVFTPVGGQFPSPNPGPSQACTAYICSKVEPWNPCTGLGRVLGNALLTVLIESEKLVNPINLDNPLGFPYAGAVGPKSSNAWASGQKQNTGAGAQDSYDPLSVGTSNTADNFGDLAVQNTDLTNPYDTENDGEGNGNGGPYGDPTVINTAVAYNATFVSDNIYTGAGSIGLFGRSRGSDFSIGVMGQSSKGCAMYGLATDENPTSSPCEPFHGIGVVGRSMGGLAPEEVSVERMVGESIGVLGQSTKGAGVRGHSGFLLKQPPTGALLPAFETSPGGVFSSGRLQDVALPPTSLGAQSLVSLDSQPQLRLVPSVGTTLPTNAQIGDFFLVMRVQSDASSPAQLFVCTEWSGTAPLWQEVELNGTKQKGGDPV